MKMGTDLFHIRKDEKKVNSVSNECLGCIAYKIFAEKCDASFRVLQAAIFNQKHGLLQGEN